MTLLRWGPAKASMFEVCAIPQSSYPGLHHGFDIGGTGSVHRGDGVAMTYPTYPQFRLLLGFRPLYFAKRHAYVFFSKNVENKTKKSPIIGGDYPPRLQDWGGHVPRIPPRGAAYAEKNMY